MNGTSCEIYQKVKDTDRYRRSGHAARYFFRLWAGGGGGLVTPRPPVFTVYTPGHRTKCIFETCHPTLHRIIPLLLVSDPRPGLCRVWMRWAGARPRRAEAVACVRSARSLDSVSRRLASFLPHNALGVSCAGFIAGPAPPPTGQRGGRTAAAMARAEHAAQSPHQIRLRALRAGYLFGRTRQDWRSVGKLRCDLRTAVPPGQVMPSKVLRRRSACGQ